MKTLLLSLLLFGAPQDFSRESRLLTSDLVDYARAIARDIGYDVSDTALYGFFVNSPEDSLVAGYTTIHFDVNGHPSGLMMLNNATGQAIEFDRCEIYDFPNLKPWQEMVRKATNARPKAPQELAEEIDCTTPPKVLTEPVPIRK